MLFCSYTGTWRGNCCCISYQILFQQGNFQGFQLISSTPTQQKRGEKCFKDALRQPHCSHQLHKSCLLKLLLSSNSWLKAVHGTDNSGQMQPKPRVQL